MPVALGCVSTLCTGILATSEHIRVRALSPSRSTLQGVWHAVAVGAARGLEVLSYVSRFVLTTEQLLGEENVIVAHRHPHFTS